MSGFGAAQWLDRVNYCGRIADAERRLDDAKQPFMPRCRLRVIQPSLDSVRCWSLTGPKPPLGAYSWLAR